jgi:hypothetical protein
MDSKLEKKMLQRLKESLKEPKEDAFEGDDVVDNLRDEFKQDEAAESDSAKPVSREELSEDDLDELIDSDSKNGAEEFAESEIITNPEPKELQNQANANGKKIEEKLSQSPNEPSAMETPKPAEPITAQAIEKPAVKKSGLGIIIFLLILFFGLILGALYFMQ